MFSDSEWIWGRHKIMRLKIVFMNITRRSIHNSTRKGILSLLILTLVIYFGLHGVYGHPCRHLTPTVVSKTDDKVKVIPRRIHQIYSGEAVLADFADWIGSWMRHHPDWEYWLWTDESISLLISSKYPQYFQVYNNLPTFYYKSDMARYIILYEYGGVYADMDMEAFRPLDSLTLSHSCILIREPLIHSQLLYNLSDVLLSNALTMCRKKHPLLKALMDNIPTDLTLFSMIQRNALYSTGPFYITKVYRDMTKNNLTVDVTLMDPKYFMNTYDSALVRFFEKICKDNTLPPEKKDVCHTFHQTRNEPNVDAFTARRHHSHMRWWTGQRIFKRTLDIQQIVPNKNLYILAHLNDSPNCS